MYIRQLNNTGDTIVEVLIAISVISLVLVGAYISTNRNLSSTQDAQERSQAIKLAETQLELVRNISTGAVDHCLSRTLAQPNNPPSVQAATGAIGANACIVDSSGLQATASTEPHYTLGISSPSSGLYEVQVIWDSLVANGQSNVTMYYEQP